MAPSEKAEIEEGGTTVNAEDLVKEGTNYTLPPEESKSLLRKIDRWSVSLGDSHPLC